MLTYSLENAEPGHVDGSIVWPQTLSFLFVSFLV